MAAEVKQSVCDQAVSARLQLEMKNRYLVFALSEDEVVRALKQQRNGDTLESGDTFEMLVTQKDRSAVVKIAVLSLYAAAAQTLAAASAASSTLSTGIPLMRQVQRARLTEATMVTVKLNEAIEFKKLAWQPSASGSGGSTSPQLFKSDWNFAEMGIGGLDHEFEEIFRLAFASRLFPPQVVAQLGIPHVRGSFFWFTTMCPCVCLCVCCVRFC